MFLRIFERTVRVECADASSAYWLEGGFGHMRVPAAQAVDLFFSVGCIVPTDAFRITTPDGRTLQARDSGEYMYLFEKELTIALEHACAHLLFVHAAALAYGDTAILLTAPSGAGKSTTTWGLLHHGFTYLSDELAPIDLTTLRVHPYPHALCLKNEPPQPYPLPPGVLRTPCTLHVPVSSLPGRPAAHPLALRAVFFVAYDPSATRPRVGPLGAAASAARIVPNLLNGLAHPGAGLDAAIRIVRATACYELHTADLAATGRLMRELVASFS
jgi:hypothetical protein